MAALIMCSVVILLGLGWMLRVNANDLKTFERELDEDLKGDLEDCS